VDVTSLLRVCTRCTITAAGMVRIWRINFTLRRGCTASAGTARTPRAASALVWQITSRACSGERAVDAAAAGRVQYQTRRLIDSSFARVQ